MTDSYFNPNGPQNKGAPQPLSPAEIPGTPPEVPHRPKEEEWKPYINEKAPLRSDDNVDLRSEPSADRKNKTPAAQKSPVKNANYVCLKTMAIMIFIVCQILAVVILITALHMNNTLDYIEPLVPPDNGCRN